VFRTAFGPLAVKRCQGEPWPASTRTCFGAARTEEAAFECVEKLTPAQRSAVEATAASVQAHGAVLTASALQLTGRLVFTERNQLHSSSEPLVTDIVRVLAAQPTLRLEIQAHAENRETSSKQATQGRADALRSRLLASGIAADRVVAKGYGADLPIASNKTARGRADNRRVWLAIKGTPAAAAPASARAILADTTIELVDKIVFAINKAEIRPESNAVLDEVAAILTANPGIELVEVQGHMDERGADTYNQKLTEDRANAVVRYLTSKGIAPKRLVAKGYGESKPLYADHSESAWASNRRIAFVIVTRR
jgi:outer membrane protein OmpA-like peptidoglycan-associated protein